MTTGARNKRAGTAWETALLRGLRLKGLDVERLRLTGAKDEGDLVVRLDGGKRIVVEAKSGTMHATDFCRQAVLEADHFAEHRGLDRADITGVAIVKARGKHWSEAHVLLPLKELFKFE